MASTTSAAAPVAHGGLDYAELRELGIEPSHIRDFSSNINPFGPPPAVRAALAGFDPAPYPDRESLVLRERLAQLHRRRISEILVGNGSNEVINLVARALVQPGDRVLVIEPTFGEYAHASLLAEAQVIRWRASGPDFAIDCDEVVNLIHEHQPRLVWLCSPNNPTGVSVVPEAIKLLAVACARVGGWLVIDRAYERFGRGDVVELGALPGVLELHSLTKTYALAGLRLGYLLGPAATLTAIGRFQPSWSVSGVAQAAGVAALDSGPWFAQTLSDLWRLSDELRAGLIDLGLEVLPSKQPFMLVGCGSASETRAALLRDGCLVRDCTSFGLPGYVRLAPRTAADNQYLINSWRKLCQRRS